MSLPQNRDSFCSCCSSGSEELCILECAVVMSSHSATSNSLYQPSSIFPTKMAKQLACLLPTAYSRLAKVIATTATPLYNPTYPLPTSSDGVTQTKTLSTKTNTKNQLYCIALILNIWLQAKNVDTIIFELKISFDSLTDLNLNFWILHYLNATNLILESWNVWISIFELEILEIWFLEMVAFECLNLIYLRLPTWNTLTWSTWWIF